MDDGIHQAVMNPMRSRKAPTSGTTQKTKSTSRAAQVFGSSLDTTTIMPGLQTVYTGTLGTGGFELASTTEAGRALIAATTVAAQRTALELGTGATLELASLAQAQAGTDNATLMAPLRVAQAIAALVGAVANLLRDQMAPTAAADTVVLKHCSGGGSLSLSHSQHGSGASYHFLAGETGITATSDCALRIALKQSRSGDANTQFAAVVRDGVVLQEWGASSTSWTARSVDVTLTAGQTLCIRLGATGGERS